jgi:hypothetical protein
MKENESGLFCMFFGGWSYNVSFHCFLIKLGFSGFFGGIVYLMFFVFKIQESFENKKINKYRKTKLIKGQYLKNKNKNKNNIFFKY